MFRGDQKPDDNVLGHDLHTVREEYREVSEWSTSFSANQDQGLNPGSVM